MSNDHESSSFQRLVEEAIANEPSWNFVSYIYRTKIAGIRRNVTTTWSKSLVNVSLLIIVENLSQNKDPYTCKIDVSTWQFWGKKGFKSFDVDETRVDVFWNFRSAKFSTSPKPCSNYHVAMVSDHEILLLLGDQEKEAIRRTKSKPCLEKPTLVLKEENVFGKNLFTTKTMLGKGGNEHYIMIELSRYDNREPEMWIGVDGTDSIRIANLQWNFRGYDEFPVDGMPIQVLWDVHDWLYMGPNIGSGIFIFRQSTNEFDPRTLSFDDKINRDDCNEFCHFLHVWKID